MINKTIEQKLKPTLPTIPGKSPAETTVVVAMSGGVDSSVVAALLHDKGYKVIGVTLQLYDQGIDLEKKGACCAGQDIYDAKMVAEKLGFAHYVLDYESVFKQDVIEDFADSYLRGETPIPCVKCNQSVKFRDLFKVAKDLGADALATGHYVQRKGSDHAELHKAVDPLKDQSYFLFATTQEQLDFLYFPLGGLHKDETRELANHYGLVVADKPESQDICFVPNGSYANIIQKLRPGALEPGDIVDQEGNVMGQHEGIAYYTVGQRRGLRISHEVPLYVIRIEPEKNQVIVGPREALAESSLTIKDANWFVKETPKKGIKVLARLHSVHKGIPATAFPKGDGTATITLDDPYDGISPGQACVMYHGDQVVGGGWICREAA